MPLSVYPSFSIFSGMKTTLILLFVFLSVSLFGQSRYVSQTTKKIVFTRDGGKCQCCGTVYDLEFDHIIPYSCGGGSKVSNIQLLCMSCNRSKSNSCYCKIHNKRVGIDCCQGNTNKSYSTKSSIRSSPKITSTARQCSGTTQKGLRCRNRTKHPSGRCHHHQKRK